MRVPILSRKLRLTLAAAALLTACFAAPRPAHAAAGDERPLPDYFDQLGLTDQQKQGVYTVMDRYDGKIEAEKGVLQRARGRVSITAVAVLVKVIKRLEAQRSDALLQILNTDQRQKLQDLQNAGKN
jgi:hypothetical protein